MTYCIRCLRPIDGLDAIRISSRMMVKIMIHVACLVDVYEEAVYANQPGNVNREMVHARNRRWRETEGARRSPPSAEALGPTRDSRGRYAPQRSLAESESS